MTSAELKAWRNARVTELRSWKVDDLVRYAKELGWKGIDPSGTFEFASWVADEEKTRLGLQAADEPVPGAVLEETEEEDERPGWALMKRLVGVEGGPEWITGPTDAARQARSALSAFAAVLMQQAMEAQEFVRWVDTMVPERTDMDVANNYHNSYPAADVTGVPWDDTINKMREAVGGKGHPFHPGDGQKPPYNIRTSSGYFIYEVVLPDFLRHFFDKNADYGDQHRVENGGLGLKGEFVGLHRKFAKMRKSIWDDEELVGEQPRELLYDLIGTALLMLDIMEQAPTEPER